MSEPQYLSTDPRAGQAVPPTPVDAHGVPLSTPRDARGQIITSKDEEPGTLDKLNEMLGPLAHPQTLTDFARLLTLPVDTVRKAASSALALAASRGPVGDAISATGRGLEKAGTALDKPLSVGGAVEMFRDPVKGTAALVAPAVARGAGRVLQRAGAFVKGAAPPVAVNPAAVPPTIGEAAEAPAAATPPSASMGPDGLLVGRPGGNPNLPDQKLLNELAIQARRVGVKLTPEMEQTAIKAVGGGASPEQAVRGLAPLAPAEAAPAAEVAWTPKKLTLSAEESKVAERLLQQGKTDQQVREAIEASRELRKRLGSPSAAEAAHDMKTRRPRTYPKGRPNGGGD